MPALSPICEIPSCQSATKGGVSEKKGTVFRTGKAGLRRHVEQRVQRGRAPQQNAVFRRRKGTSFNRTGKALLSWDFGPSSPLPTSLQPSQTFSPESMCRSSRNSEGETPRLSLQSPVACGAACAAATVFHRAKARLHTAVFRRAKARGFLESKNFKVLKSLSVGGPTCRSTLNHGTSPAAPSAAIRASPSHWREFFYFDDTPSPSLLKRLIKVDGGAAEWQNSRQRLASPKEKILFRSLKSSARG